MTKTTTLIKLRSDDSLDILEEILGCSITFKEDNVYTLSEPMGVEDYNRLINGFDFSTDKKGFLETLKSEALSNLQDLLEDAVINQKCIQCGNPNKKYTASRLNEKVHTWQAMQTHMALGGPIKFSSDETKDAADSINTGLRLNARYKEIKGSLSGLSLKELVNFNVNDSDKWDVSGMRETSR